MDKLKQILKPGHSSAATDEQLYGTSDPLNHPAGENDPQLHSSDKAKKDSGLMRQILNPGGDKYDETRFTETATTEAPQETVTGGNEEALLSGERAQKDSGLLRQILNPGGDKYDETRFTTTGATPTAAPDAGLEPQAGGASGLTSTYNDQSSQLRPPQTSTDDGMSTASIKSGVPGLPQSGSDYPQAVSGSQIPASQTNTAGQYGSATGSAALAAASVATGSGGAQTGARDRPGSSEFSSEHHDGYAHVQATTTARKYSLGGSRRPENIGSSTTAPYSTGGATRNTSSSPQSSGGYGTGAAALGAAGALGSLGTSAAQEPSRQPATHQPAGVSSSANSAAVAAARQAAGQPHPSSSAGGSHAQAPYSYPNYGPHETYTANRLDPNVDSSAQAAARAAPGAAARDEHSSSLGRDVGLASAGAAVAGGAYAADKGHGRYDSAQGAGAAQSSTGPAPHTIGPHKSDALNVLDPRVQPQPELMKGSSKGANQTATDPAPHTIGPHKSDALNVIDPRVQPQPEKQGAKDRNADAAATAAAGAGAATMGASALASHPGNTATSQSAATRPPATDRTQTGSYQDHGPLSDRRQEDGEKWRGWQNPYSSAAVDPRLDDMPGAFPETPSEQLDKLLEQQSRTTGLGAAATAGAVGAGAGATRSGYDDPSLQRVSERREPMAAAAVRNRPRTPENQKDVGMAVTTNEAVPSPTHREFTRGPEYGAVSRVEDHDEEDRGHHYGRDALVAGGVGAAGVGTYEAAKQHEKSKGPLTTKDIYGEEAVKPKPVQQQPVSSPQSGSESSSKPIFGQFESKAPQQAPLASTGTKPIFGDFDQKSSQQATPEKADPDHHYGRDAAIAGGAGAAGLAGYEATKDQPRVPTSNREIYGEDAVKPKPMAGAVASQPSQQPKAPLSTREIYGEEAVQPKPVAGAVASQPSQQPNAPLSTREIYGDDAVKPKPVKQPSPASGARDNQHGRDAAIAGGTGAAAGVGAHEAYQQSGLSHSSSGQSQQTSPAPHLRAAHNIYPPEVFQSHHQQPTSAATAGGLGGDSATGEADSSQQQAQEHHYGRDAALAGGAAGVAGAGAYAATRDSPQQGYQTSPQTSKAYQHAPPATGTFQPPTQSNAFEQPRQAPAPPAQQHYGRDAALAGGAGAAAVGVGAHDYATEPSRAQRDPVAAMQGAVTHGYDDQRAAPQISSRHFDPVRGGALDEDGVSHPHSHAHPAYYPDHPPAEQPQVHREGRDAVVAAAVGGGAAGAGLAGAGHPTQSSEPVETFDPMNPTGVQHTGPFHSHHRHTPSGTSSRYSEDNTTPDSPTGSKRKHKILTFLNKKDDRDSSPRSSLDRDHGGKDAYAERDYAAADRQQATEQQGAPYGLDGSEGHEFGGVDAGDGSGLHGSTGSVGPGGSPRSGHNKLRKDPPKKVQERLMGQQNTVSEAPPRID